MQPAIYTCTHTHTQARCCRSRVTLVHSFLIRRMAALNFFFLCFSYYLMLICLSTTVNCLLHSLDAKRWKKESYEVVSALVSVLIKLSDFFSLFFSFYNHWRLSYAYNLHFLRFRLIFCGVVVRLNTCTCVYTTESQLKNAYCRN